VATAAAALYHGARILDGSLGGLSGCPFAPGATGNVVFEDLVFLRETEGFAAGIDSEALTSVPTILGMPDEPLYGAFARAGPPPGIAFMRLTSNPETEPTGG
jgi:hydroxymethylglutaryl-CoA lyase